MKRSLAVLLASATLAGAPLAAAPGQAKEQPPVDAKAWSAVVDKAISYLKTSQDANGGWSTATSPGVTGIALTGMLKTKRVTPDDPVAAKALKYIESLVNREHGHIAGKDPKVQLQNYVTSINVMALVEAKQGDKYKAIIGDATEFLKNAVMRCHTIRSYSCRFRFGAWSLGWSLRGGASLCHRCDKPVSHPSDRMHESRLLGIVLQHLSQLAHGRVDAVIRVQEHILAPDPFHDLIPRYQLSPALHQQKQQFHWDAGQLQSLA